MKISSEKAKVNRKPLFKTRTNVQESAHDGRREEESLPIAPDQKRTKITCQDDFSETEVRTAVSGKGDYVLSMINECSTPIATRTKHHVSSEENQDARSTHFCPAISHESSEKVNADNQLSIKIRRKNQTNEYGVY